MENNSPSLSSSWLMSVDVMLNATLACNNFLFRNDKMYMKKVNCGFRFSFSFSFFLYLYSVNQIIINHIKVY